VSLVGGGGWVKVLSQRVESARVVVTANRDGFVGNETYLH